MGSTLSTAACKPFVVARRKLLARRSLASGAIGAALRRQQARIKSAAFPQRLRNFSGTFELDDIRPLADVDLDGRADLVRRYRLPLIRYFWRHGVPMAYAEDLAQDCFARIFSLATRAHIQSEESYLFKTASSVFIDYVRSNASRQIGRHIPIDGIDSIEIDEKNIEMNSPERVCEGKDTLRRIEAALRELKPKTREIFLLKRLDGLSYTQIAVRFGLTQSAIEKHVIAALAHLHKRLGDLRT
jgi:RNA polymerase sigma-70 factor (ECF subfamily)